MDRNVVGDVMGKALAEVALRKESVDRNALGVDIRIIDLASLSARRAWIEIDIGDKIKKNRPRRSPQGERG